MDKLIKSVAISLADNNFIKDEDIEIVSYGIEMFIISVLEMGAVLILSAFVGNFAETVVYFIGFIPIRMYSGGYHADTRLRCFIILLMVYALFSIVSRYSFLPQYGMVAFIMSVINLLLVYMWAPLPNVNKSVNEKERVRYRKMSIILSGLGCAVTAAIIIFNISSIYAQAFIWGLFAEVTSLAAGKIKNLMKGAGKNE